MKKIAFVALLFLMLSPTAFAQKIAKALAFAQIAAGGTSPEIWETIVNLTNRGTNTYTGVFTLYTMSSGTPQPWNPIVNGDANTFTNGQMVISLSPGTTTTLTLTGGSTTLTGFGIITPTSSSSTDETSFVEGTLTYYVMNGDTVTDSIGIPPSDQLYITTIPFDTFENIGLALANGNATASTLTLNLYSSSGEQMGSQQLVLQPNEHVAEYLYQIFSNVQMTGGRLDIFSDTSFYGVAVTDVNNQFSSLPLLPAVKTFNWTVNFGASVLTGTVSFQFHGTQGAYQSTILTRNGNPVANPSIRYVVGTFNAPTFSAYDVDQPDNEIQYWSFGALSFSMPVVAGDVEIWTISNTTITFQGQGTISMTATN
jgi:hypothetical protein